MRLFFQKSKNVEQQFAFQVGLRLRLAINHIFDKLAEFLNQWQFRVGFKIRNLFIISIFLGLILYFIWTLLIVFQR